MEQLIASIYESLKDYRADENNPSVRMTKKRIETWIDQFDEPLRIPILTELDSIFKKRYCTKADVEKCLGEIVDVFADKFGFKNPVDFLKNTDFLDLQGKEKSQKVMLSIFDEIIQDKYGISLNECGSISKKYSLYIDDVLCTGLKMMTNITGWLDMEFSKGKTNSQALADKSTKLILFYIITHEKNYEKKQWEMEQKMPEVAANHQLFYMLDIKNGISSNSSLDLIYPLEENQSEQVIEYKNEIVELVDEYSKEKKYKPSKEEFYRPAGLPKNEVIFTSPNNRAIVENAFLEKGIEILKKSDVRQKNMRALGYSIPSQKSFGFGGLCFTWRNVPNNTPLVFWWDGGGFTPLFKVRRGEVFDFSRFFAV